MFFLYRRGNKIIKMDGLFTEVTDNHKDTRSQPLYQSRWLMEPIDSCWKRTVLHSSIQMMLKHSERCRTPYPRCRSWLQQPQWFPISVGYTPNETKVDYQLFVRIFQVFLFKREQIYFMFYTKRCKVIVKIHVKSFIGA